MVTIRNANTLRAMTDGAPRLATLRLELCTIYGRDNGFDPHYRGDDEDSQLHCPALTAMAATDCHWALLRRPAIYLDAPRLEYLAYEGQVAECPISLSP